MVLIVTVPSYHCLSLTLHNFILVLIYFGQLKALSEVREEHHVARGIPKALLAVNSCCDWVCNS